MMNTPVTIRKYTVKTFVLFSLFNFSSSVRVFLLFSKFKQVYKYKMSRSFYVTSSNWLWDVLRNTYSRKYHKYHVRERTNHFFFLQFTYSQLNSKILEMENKKKRIKFHKKKKKYDPLFYFNKSSWKKIKKNHIIKTTNISLCIRYNTWNVFWSIGCEHTKNAQKQTITRFNRMKFRWI